MKKKSILLYLDMLPMLEELKPAGCGRVVLALLRYSSEGAEAHLRGCEHMAYSFIRSQLDRDAEKYELRCERNRTNGHRGGRPPLVEEGACKKPKKPKRFLKNRKKPIQIQIRILKQKLIRRQKQKQKQRLIRRQSFPAQAARREAEKRRFSNRIAENF